MATVPAIMTADRELLSALIRADTHWGLSYDIAAASADITSAEASQFYVGSALCYRLSDTAAANAGKLMRVPLAASQTKPMVFAGVNMNNPLQPDNPETTVAAGSKIGLLRKGCVAFYATSGSDRVTTNLDYWVGRLVWFHSDQEVGLNVPAANYPILAGRVIAAPGSDTTYYLTGHAHIPAGCVLVDIGVGINNPVHEELVTIPFHLAVATANYDILGANTSAGGLPIRSYGVIRDVTTVLTYKGGTIASGTTGVHVSGTLKATSTDWSGNSAGAINTKEVAAQVVPGDTVEVLLTVGAVGTAISTGYVTLRMFLAR